MFAWRFVHAAWICYNARMKNQLCFLLAMSGAVAVAAAQPWFEMPFSVIGNNEILLSHTKGHI